jgi:ribosomal protein L11 methyltransferase
MSWLEISFEVQRDAVASATDILEASGALSVTLSDAGDDPVLEPGAGETPLWPRTRLTGLFPMDGEIAATAAALERALPDTGRGSLHVARLDDRVWEREWLKAFRPMRFGRRLWVCPRDRTVEAADAIIVHLDPGLAFGTGTHPTTALCLEWLDSADLAGRTVVDYGCGSGILAIAAALLGAGRVVAVDHDPQALAATADNARRNCVAGRIDVHGPDCAPDFRADVVMANILAAPLVELAALLAGRTRPGGTLVLSGILAPQAAAIEQAYRRFCAIESELEKDGWLRVVARRLGQED